MKIELNEQEIIDLRAICDAACKACGLAAAEVAVPILDKCRAAAEEGKSKE